MQVPAAAWREWAGSSAFLRPLGRRLHDIGLTRRQTKTQIDRALSDASWRGLAAVDAATRMIASLQSTGALSRSRGLNTLIALTAATDGDSPTSSIAEQCWSVRPTPADDEAETLTLRGAVLVHVNGVRHNHMDSRAPAISRRRLPYLLSSSRRSTNQPCVPSAHCGTRSPKTASWRRPRPCWLFPSRLLVLCSKRCSSGALSTWARFFMPQSSGYGQERRWSGSLRFCWA